MNTTTIRALLRAAIFTGAIGALPTAALADTGNQPTGEETYDSIPDHAQVEARGGDTSTTTTEEKASRAPDHATAEDRGAGETTTTIEERSSKAPDHATAEDRGHAGDQD